ncbi:MAG: DUF192 domain-containing protein [Acidimicrobiia bacterium]
MAWLLRDRDVLAAAEIATTRRARRRGLLGQDDFDGALVLRPCRQVHTFGMRFPLDVAFCDGDGRVLRTYQLAAWRISPIVFRARWAVEARAGAFERWRLRLGDALEVRE